MIHQVWHEERGEKCISSNIVSFLPGELWKAVHYNLQKKLSEMIMECLLITCSPPTGCPEISVLHDGRECLVTTEVTSVFFLFVLVFLKYYICFRIILGTNSNNMLRWTCLPAASPPYKRRSTNPCRRPGPMSNFRKKKYAIIVGQMSSWPSLL